MSLKSYQVIKSYETIDSARKINNRSIEISYCDWSFTSHRIMIS